MSDFPIYYPWSIWQSKFVMETARKDLCILDVQLGSECNARCPRCDSSCFRLSEPATLDIEAISAFADEISKRTHELRCSSALGIGVKLQGFVCGLGEPTYGENLKKLKALIRQTKLYGFSWSMFNNGLYWDDELDEFLKNGDLSIMVQCNSSKPDLVAKMLGKGEQEAMKHLENRKHFWELAQRLKYQSSNIPAGCTNIAASIVPDTDNYMELADLLDECVRCNVFPNIGELEQAGNSKGSYYEQHSLGMNELKDLLGYINLSYGVKYELPICPAAIGAIHVNNRNMVTVDKATGLSCGWFGMGDPEVVEIGDIRKMSYKEVVKRILEYRESRIDYVRATINSYPEMVFGGCGGNARRLLTEYVSLYD